MKMLISTDDHHGWLSDNISKNPNRITIASYGIYAGISYAGQDTTKWGGRYRSATRDLMERMRTVSDVRLLIGISEYKSCKGFQSCLDCEKQYVKQLIRIANHAELFDCFQWRISTELHLKAYLFEHHNRIAGLAGGRNFTDSSWTDCSFELDSENSTTLMRLVDETWCRSRTVSDSSLAEIFSEQEISEKGFNSVVLGET